MLTSPPKPFRPTHGLKREKGEGEIRGRVESARWHFPPFLHFQPLQRWLRPLASHPQRIALSKALLLSSPTHRKRKRCAQFTQMFPPPKIKRKSHTLSVCSAEAENPVPRHFTLNVEMTQSNVFTACVCSLVCFKRKSSRGVSLLLELAKCGLFFQHFEVVRLNV